MFSKKSILSLIIFCLCFGYTPSVQAIEITPKTKMIGGSALALIGAAGTWYCYKKTKACDEKIKQLNDDDLDDEEFDEKAIKKLEDKRWWYNLFTWISGGAAITGTGVAMWSWYHWYNDWTPGQEVELIPQIASVTPLAGGGYALRGPGDFAITITPEEVGAGKRTFSATDSTELIQIEGVLSIGEGVIELIPDEDLPRNLPLNVPFQNTRELKDLAKETAAQIKSTVSKIRNNQTLNRKDEFILGLIGHLVNPANIARLQRQAMTPVAQAIQDNPQLQRRIMLGVATNPQILGNQLLQNPQVRNFIETNLRINPDNLPNLSQELHFRST